MTIPINHMIPPSTPLKNERLRILWLSHLIPYPPKSGVLMRSYYLIREVARYHDVDLFAFNQRRQLLSHFESEATGVSAARGHFASFIGRFEILPIPAETRRWGRHSLAISSIVRGDPYTINWLKSASARATIETLLSDTKYDLLHFDTISLAPYLDPNCALPSVLDHHNIESHMMLRRSTNTKNFMKRVYFKQEGIRLRRYERKNLGRLQGHIVCSDEDRARLLDIDNGLNVAVIPNGIRVGDSVPPRNPTAPPKLLFIGGLDWYPNADAVTHFLEEIWPQLKSKVPQIHIDIIGKKPSQKLLDLSKGDRQVTVHGFVDNIDLFYEQAGVYVCPIRDGGGTKLKVLDAFAHRVPVVGYPAALEGLDVEDGIHCRIANSSNEFAEVVARLLGDSTLYKALSAAALELVRQKYDVRSIGKKLATFYNETVGVTPAQMS